VIAAEQSSEEGPELCYPLAPHQSQNPREKIGWLPEEFFPIAFRRQIAEVLFQEDEAYLRRR
jgi:hypothetical protein